MTNSLAAAFIIIHHREIDIGCDDDGNIIWATADGTSNQENEAPASPLPSTNTGVEESMGALAIIPSTPPPPTQSIAMGKTPRTVKKPKSYKD